MHRQVRHTVVQEQIVSHKTCIKDLTVHMMGNGHCGVRRPRNLRRAWSRPGMLVCQSRMMEAAFALFRQLTVSKEAFPQL